MRMTSLFSRICFFKPPKCCSCVNERQKKKKKSFPILFENGVMWMARNTQNDTVTLGQPMACLRGGALSVWETCLKTVIFLYLTLKKVCNFIYAVVFTCNSLKASIFTAWHDIWISLCFIVLCCAFIVSLLFAPQAVCYLICMLWHCSRKHIKGQFYHNAVLTWLKMIGPGNEGLPGEQALRKDKRPTAGTITLSLVRAGPALYKRKYIKHQLHYSRLFCTQQIDIQQLISFSYHSSKHFTHQIQKQTNKQNPLKISIFYLVFQWK